MRYLQSGVVVVLFLFACLAAIPAVWMGLVLAPIPLLLMAPALVLGGIFYGALLEDRQGRRCARVLLVDNDGADAKMLREILEDTWSIKYAATSLGGVGCLLRDREFDVMLIRWTRRKLSGEAILDYLDEAVRLHNSRGGEGREVSLPPVLFLRKLNAAPFEINGVHLAPVLGCISLDSDKLADEIQNCVQNVG